MKTEDIGPVLIVDNEQSKTLVGIVTDRDIVVKVIAERQDVTTTRVGDVMSKKLITCRADDDVDERASPRGHPGLAVLAAGLRLPLACPSS